MAVHELGKIKNIVLLLARSLLTGYLSKADLWRIMRVEEVWF
jgi:hypothetical protein